MALNMPRIRITNVRARADLRLERELDMDVLVVAGFERIDDTWAKLTSNDPRTMCFLWKSPTSKYDAKVECVLAATGQDARIGVSRAIALLDSVYPDMRAGKIAICGAVAKTRACALDLRLLHQLAGSAADYNPDRFPGLLLYCRKLPGCPYNTTMMEIFAGGRVNISTFHYDELQLSLSYVYTHLLLAAQNHEMHYGQ